MTAAKLKKFWRNYRYESIAVINGAIIMVLEIVGARMIAPYFGTSIYVWTAVIGVILGALAIGYWQGGVLADRGASDRKLSGILILAAAILLLTQLIRDVILTSIAGLGIDLRIEALLAALLLFAPANILMGVVSPYLAKLKMTSLDKAGASIGRLYAAGTAGSILGTFAAGYWLVAWLGNRALAMWLVIGLLMAATAVAWRAFGWWRLALGVGAILMLLSFGRAATTKQVLYDGDTAYGHFQVVQTTGANPRRFLLGDGRSHQSGIYVDDPGKPLFSYMSRFQLAAQVSKPQRILLIGGGGYTLPRLIWSQNPQAQIDIVEIDPTLSQLGEKYFGFQPNSRAHIINEDGRTFLNGSPAQQNQYDLIFMDAFTAASPPFQLTTTEAVDRLATHLAPHGAVVVNLISAFSGAGSQFGAAEQATYRRHFKVVRSGPTAGHVAADVRQNIILVAGTAGGAAETIASALHLDSKMPDGLVLTDDFAPVEQMTAP